MRSRDHLLAKVAIVKTTADHTSSNYAANDAQLQLT